MYSVFILYVDVERYVPDLSFQSPNKIVSNKY